MDIIIVREIATVVSFLTFVGILFYAAHPKNKTRFEEQARKVLEEDDRK
jgi:cbb3-type cytochrome oxidase subunit 3